jgi:PIN domain nuclease of toxin-antitoxin system
LGAGALILLDTHVWVWWLSDPTDLSQKAQHVIEGAIGKNAIAISSISCWELAMLVKLGRLQLDRPLVEWIAASENLPFINFIPVNNEITVDSVNLPEPIHKDPVDRMMIATARIGNWQLVTKDHKIRKYPHVTTIW